MQAAALSGFALCGSACLASPLLVQTRLATSTSQVTNQTFSYCYEVLNIYYQQNNQLKETQQTIEHIYIYIFLYCHIVKC